MPLVRKAVKPHSSGAAVTAQKDQPVDRSSARALQAGQMSLLGETAWLWESSRRQRMSNSARLYLCFKWHHYFP